MIFCSFISQAQDEDNPCLQTPNYHIVILGSSTAAGTGPSASDSAWVNRYRKFIQSINPSNQVTNLAVGGTTTYHIMPDWFVPPAARPSPTSNNVSQAIALGADAIIVNMPSNDASNNFGLNEQMTNFTTIAAVADSSNIPVWVCTTQPKNYGNMAQIQIQLDVRDSILNYFGNKAIDFWTSIANTSNTIDTLYDSGDGTHLNDAAHKLLFERVKSENLLSHLYDTLSYKDYSIRKIFAEDNSVCGDSINQVKAIITNLGVSTMDTLFLELAVVEQQSGAAWSVFDTLMAGGSCIADTACFTLPTHLGGTWQAQAFISVSKDTIPTNDSSAVLSLSSIAQPSLWISGADSVCFGDTISFLAQTVATDTVLWYKKDSLIGGGNSFEYGPWLASDSLTAKAIRGPLVFKEKLTTTETSQINWNGTMFNLVAKDSIVIDSLALKVFSSGDQGVIGYYRLGSYRTAASNSSAWTYWGLDSLFGVNTGEFHSVSFGSLILNPGDTLGVYLHMENSASNLSYQNNGNATVVSTSELDFVSGSGISHTFGTEYYPRFWSGSIFYHFGFNPDGDCATTLEVPVIVNKPTLNLGPDITLFNSDSTLLQAPSNFSSYTWNWVESGVLRQLNTPSITINSTFFWQAGTYKLWLDVTDSMGCMASDTLMVSFFFFDLPENLQNDLKLYPNPAQGYFEIETQLPWELKLYDNKGQLLLEQTISSGKTRFSDSLKAGLYTLVFRSDEGLRVRKLLIL
jgi:lysophospholipase L1-like esterase